MARLDELANELSYAQIATMYAEASDNKSEASAILSMLKKVIEIKLSNDENAETTQRTHTESGEDLNTTTLPIGPYKAKIREGLAMECDFKNVQDKISSLWAQNIAAGDREVSERQILRDVLDILEESKEFKPRKTIEITM